MKIDFQRAAAVPEGALEVVLVRHGAVDPPGPGGLIAGRSDPPLNARGIEQAEAVARRLAGEPVGSVFTTTMRRAVQTAELIVAERDLEVVAVEALGEVFLGEWEGHGIHDRGSRGDPEFLRMMRQERWDLIPGAEPAEAFAERVRAGLEVVAEAAAPGGAAVVVTHGGVIAEACRQVTGSRPFAFLRSANGSLTRLVRMPDGSWALMAFNETEHLPRETTVAGMAGGERGVGR